MELIIQFLFEFLIPFIAEILIDLLIHIGADIPSINKFASNVLSALIYLGIGVFIGWVSLWFFPNAFVRSESLHGISLFITPVLAGSMMAAIGWLRRQQGSRVIRLESFSYAYVLALGMALIRFYFTD